MAARLLQTMQAFQGARDLGSQLGVCRTVCVERFRFMRFANFILWWRSLGFL
jgi:hypothetical protein